MNESHDSSAANIPLLVVYWLVVGIPLVWGVVLTVEKVKPLFNQ